MLPAAFENVARSIVGPFAVYAPFTLGNFTLWRGFLTGDFDTDVVVATPSAGCEGTFHSFASRAAPRFLVGTDPHYIARPAHRGVRLVDVLEHSAGARPPLELFALTALALARPGLRLSGLASPHQIVVSWRGEILVDGFDPDAQPRLWATADATTLDVEACVLAACAAGSPSFEVAREFVDKVASNQAADGIVARSIIARFANPAENVDELAGLIDGMPHARAAVSGLVRSLFPDRYAAYLLEREQQAMVDVDLSTWTLTPRTLASAERKAIARQTAMFLSEARAEQVRISSDLGELIADTARTLHERRTRPAPAKRPWSERVAMVLASLAAWLRRRRSPVASLLRGRKQRRRRRRAALDVVSPVEVDIAPDTRA